MAKHTPSEVIMLALSSAMLEQYPSKMGKFPSKRLEAITYFLEEAVKVVPVESIFYAIGYCDLDTAVECAEALLHAKPNIPASAEAVLGAQRAAVRMRTGLHGMQFDNELNIFCKILNTTLGGVSFISLTASNSEELIFSGISPVSLDLTPMYSNVVQTITTQHVPVTSKRKLCGLENVKKFPLIADKLCALENTIRKKLKPECNVAVCGRSIEHVYPIAHSTRRHIMSDSTLKSPIEVLRNARKDIAALLEEDQDLSAQGTEANNERMLSLVREIMDHNLKICASLIGGFMENQIRIPLLKSEVGTVHMLSETSSPVAIGVWALFNLSFNDLHQMLRRMQGNPLLLEIADYISNIASDEHSTKSSSHSSRHSKYAGKLQFLLQGMRNKTISFSNQYISYTLERQLCSNLKFDKKTTVNELTKQWDMIFKGDALSLVAKSHRSLVARWLKWVVLVHDLRESLAKYTCVGVIGVINSGKSYLVSKLFDIQVSKEPCDLTV